MKTTCETLMLTLLLTACSSEGAGESQSADEEAPAPTAAEPAAPEEEPPAPPEEPEEPELTAEQVAEAALAAEWASLVGEYECTGRGVVAGLVVTPGQVHVGLTAAANRGGNQDFPAELNEDQLTITDPRRGPMTWRVEDEGATIVPNSPAYARRCTKAVD